MNNYFAQDPIDVDAIIAIVKREAEEECRNDELPAPALDRCVREAVAGFWDGSVKSFVPLLALRRVRCCIRAGTCDCDDW